MPPKYPQRRPLRLQAYDYSRPGGYFITICSEKRLLCFGNIVNGTMVLNDSGLMVAAWWHKLSQKFSLIELDAFVVMPNHVHGIIFIIDKSFSHPEGADPCVRPNADIQIPKSDPRPSVGTILQWFKTMTTNQYIARVKQTGWLPFSGRLWQRNYYEHVIRDEKSLDRIREYINTNPLRWHLDQENKSAQGKDDFDDWLSSFTKRPA